MEQSSVYILVDTKNHRLKIGKANQVQRRIKAFHYASIDFDKSIEIVCRDERASNKIERMLHNRFDDYRLSCNEIGEFDGKSEWFSIGIMDSLGRFIEQNKSDERILKIYNQIKIQHSCEVKHITAERKKASNTEEADLLAQIDENNAKSILESLNTLLEICEQSNTTYKKNTLTCYGYVQYVIMLDIDMIIDTLHKKLECFIETLHGGYSITPSITGWYDQKEIEIAYNIPTIGDELPLTKLALESFCYKVERSLLLF